eukprot:scaffold2475_cov115-Isochrysis_galbana.AAC.1
MARGGRRKGGMEGPGHPSPARQYRWGRERAQVPAGGGQSWCPHTQACSPPLAPFPLTGSMSPGTHEEAHTADAMSTSGVSSWLSMRGGARRPRVRSGVHEMLSTRPECAKASSNVIPREKKAMCCANSRQSYSLPCASSCRSFHQVEPWNGPSAPISRQSSASPDSTGANSASVRVHRRAATTAPAEVP